MSKLPIITTLCIIISLLFFLSLSSSAVARRVATFPDVTPMEIKRKDSEVKRGSAEDSCKGLKEEECLMRKTVEAHLDYIYTQKHKQP